MLNGITWQNALGLAIFIVMCGFIAYFGDLLGRKMGKKRLSLLGMRPRYTAIAMTAVTGMLIAVLTISIMAGLSQRVRLLMLRGLAIVSERKQMETQLASTHRAYDRASTQLKEEELALVQARKDATAAERKRDEIIKERDRLAQSLVHLKGDLRRNKQELASAQRSLMNARGDLTSARKEITVRRIEIKKQQVAIAELEDKRIKLLVVSRELAKAAKDAIGRLKAMQERDIAYRLGDEVSRTVIDCSKSKKEIRQEILGLIDAADKKARTLGCAGAENGRAVEILPIEVNGKFIPESEVIDAIADNISAGKGSVVTRVISLSNTVVGEQALVNFSLHPDRLVYKAGEEVSSIVIDGGLSRGHIFGALVQFFKSNVRAAAISKGVIPSTDDDGQPSVGQIPGETLFYLVDRIKSSGTEVRVHASAAKDTWSADTLVLDLNVGDRL
ncbi:MAG TPA: DUF3084 domain-containing protein [Armatimonadota bacterium]|jgi:hypothetical protein